MNDKQAKIKEIFASMEYGNVVEDVKNAKEWIKSNEKYLFAYINNKDENSNGTPTTLKNAVNAEETLCTVYTPDTETIKKIVSLNEKKNDLPVVQKAQVMQKIATEIEKNEKLFAEIEIVSRGIQSKDTKNYAIPLLVQYFQYYSSFAVRYREEAIGNKDTTVLAIISNENTLATLGMVLGPALAAGCRVVLSVGTKFSLATLLLSQLCIKAGIPQEFIRIIPTDNLVDVELLADSPKIKLISFAAYNQKFLEKFDFYFPSCKTPMLIFENADLNSACESIVQAAWGYQGMLPWSVNTILIQENIFETFATKLKNKIRNTTIGFGNDQMADISYPCNTQSYAKQQKVVTEAKSLGLEVFPTDSNTSKFTPTIVIGGKVFTNNVILEDSDDGVVYLQAFRTLDEAVSLANNSRQGLGASVWTENVGVLNEVSKKLQVGNVWINSHGLTAVDIPMTPFKQKTNAMVHIGGNEGFLNYLSKQRLLVEESVSLDLQTAIASSKKAQESWTKVSKYDKVNAFYKFADYLEKNREPLSCRLSKEKLDSLIFSIYECVSDTNNGSSITSRNGYSVSSSREPLGVVAIGIGIKSQNMLDTIIFLLGVVFQGNSTIVVDSKEDETMTMLCKEFGNLLPKGVVTIVPPTTQLNVTAYNENFKLDVKSFTLIKNVWSTIGQSCQCNL